MVSRQIHIPWAKKWLTVRNKRKCAPASECTWDLKQSCMDGDLKGSSSSWPMRKPSTNWNLKKSTMRKYWNNEEFLPLSYLSNPGKEINRLDLKSVCFCYSILYSQQPRKKKIWFSYIQLGCRISTVNPRRKQLPHAGDLVKLAGRVMLTLYVNSNAGQDK